MSNPAVDRLKAVLSSHRRALSRLLSRYMDTLGEGDTFYDVSLDDAVIEAKAALDASSELAREFELMSKVSKAAVRYVRLGDNPKRLTTMKFEEAVANYETFMAERGHTFK